MVRLTQETVIHKGIVIDSSNGIPTYTYKSFDILTNIYMCICV